MHLATAAIAAETHKNLTTESSNTDCLTGTLSIYSSDAANHLGIRQAYAGVLHNSVELVLYWTFDITTVYYIIYHMK